MATVDVVIPCYKYAHYLPGCVESVLSQPGVDVRALIIDDCSPDDTEVVGKAFAAADPRVEFRRHAVNKGHIATYNEGLLEWARGDYVSLLSADDLVAPGCLSRAVEIMENDKRIGMVYGRVPDFLHNEEIKPSVSRDRGYNRYAGREWFEGRCRSGWNAISCPGVVVRRAVQEKIGGYNPKLPHAGDLEMWLRIALVSDIAYARGKPQGYYRVHGASMYRTVYDTWIADAVERRNAYRSALAEARDVWSDAAELEAMVMRKLAAQALDRVCRSYDRDRVDGAMNEGLIAFAFETCSDVTTLPEWARVQRHVQRGRRSRWAPASVASATIRRSREEVARLRWKRTGVF